MLALNCSIPVNPKSITRSFSCFNPTHQRQFAAKFRTSRVRFVTLARNGDEPVTKEESSSTLFDDENGGGGGGGGGKDGRRALFDINWADLLNPDADNVLAVGLTGLLTWASAQVLWQLLFISLAILVAAVKYSLIAAILLFILITLL